MEKSQSVQGVAGLRYKVIYLEKKPACVLVQQFLTVGLSVTGEAQLLVDSTPLLGSGVLWSRL